MPPHTLHYYSSTKYEFEYSGKLIKYFRLIWFEAAFVQRFLSLLCHRPHRPAVGCYLCVFSFFMKFTYSTFKLHYWTLICLLVDRHSKEGRRAGEMSYKYQSPLMHIKLGELCYVFQSTIVRWRVVRNLFIKLWPARCLIFVNQKTGTYFRGIQIKNFHVCILQFTANELLEKTQLSAHVEKDTRNIFTYFLMKTT